MYVKKRRGYVELTRSPYSETVGKISLLPQANKYFVSMEQKEPADLESLFSKIIKKHT